MLSKKPILAQSGQHMHAHDRIFQRSDSLQELAYSPYCLSSSDLRQILYEGNENDTGTAVLSTGRETAVRPAANVEIHDVPGGAITPATSAPAGSVPQVAMSAAKKTSQGTHRVASEASKRNSSSQTSMSSSFSSSSSAGQKTKGKEKNSKKGATESEKKSRFSKWLTRRSNLSPHGHKPLTESSKLHQCQMRVEDVNATTPVNQQIAAGEPGNDGHENQSPTIQEQHRENDLSSTLSRLQHIEEILELFAVSTARMDATPAQPQQKSVPQTRAASTQTSPTQLQEEIGHQRLLHIISELNTRLDALEIYSSNLERISYVLSDSNEYYQQMQSSFRAESSSLQKQILKSEAEIIAQLDARLRQFMEERDKLITDQHEIIEALSVQLGQREQEIASLKEEIQRYESEIRSLRVVVKQYEGKMQEIERDIGCLEGQWAWIQPLIQRAKSEGC